MKISILKNGIIIYNIDYSNREDCLWYFEVSKIQLEKIEKWASYKIEKWKLNIIETEEYLQNQIQNKEKLIKEKYQKIIFDKYSLTDQLNLSNEALFISSTAQAEKRDFTEKELEKLEEVKNAKIWIDSQKKLCWKEILKLNW